MERIRFVRRLAIPGLIAALGMLAAACGNASSANVSSSSQNFATKATIKIPKADRFEPFLVEVAQGATVTFTNQDSDAHTVVSMPTDPVDFKLFVQSGKSVSHTFNQPGIYSYYCDAHSNYDSATGLIKANKQADAYPISMYGIILVDGPGLAIQSGNAKVVMPSSDRFDPLAIVVRQGTRVSWSNLDSDAHTVLTDPTDSTQFKFVAPANGAVSYTFNQIGMFPYYCDAHATWNTDLKRVQARAGADVYPEAMEGVVFVVK